MTALLVYSLQVSSQEFQILLQLASKLILLDNHNKTNYFAECNQLLYKFFCTSSFILCISTICLPTTLL